MDNLRSKISYRIIAIAAIAASCLVIICSTDPDASLWAPKCIFHTITGYNCPGCGIQRAIYHASKGEFLTALSYNYVLPAIAAVVTFFLIAEICRRSHPRFYLAAHNPIVIGIVFILTAAWWIGRNIAGV